MELIVYALEYLLELDDVEEWYEKEKKSKEKLCTKD